MALETDSQEVIELGSDTVVGQMRTTTIHVSGGIGGQGGRGGQEGGTGGKGEAPTFNVSGPVGRIVHVSDRSKLLVRALDLDKSEITDINTDGPHKISLCDIYLQRQVYMDDPQRCSRRRRNAVRKYYTAEVKDRKDMTLVVYEGQDAEEEFKEDVARSMKFRHPSFLQLYGIVHSGNIYASIFYDVLIPWRDIERIYQPFLVMFCYIYASASNEFKAASDYFEYRFGSTQLRRSFQVGPVSFKCPENVGYWSLDPLGVERLSVEQAAELGFPTIRVLLRGSFESWGDTVYAGLRQFHEGKGFDPDSQDLARHLGMPLYELYSDYDNSMDVDDDDFEAHIEEASSTDSDSDTDQPMDID
ncbi:hypothetical protein R3P38DRAFT_3263136 [Favolaschia claudopus]|uniref:Uncharacterized protein n=1 Tax=Favolaschia claudopus TaxID=2862362 RepID=A0AAW0CA99_9AGAR